MKTAIFYACKVLIFVLIFMGFVSHVVVADKEKDGPKKQLQIGIKKRVGACPIKSRKGDILHMHYEGFLDNLDEFDSSYSRDTPLTFTLGTGQVIKGWDQGLMGMCEGEQRKLVVPPELGYGAAGAPPKIPPNADLTFIVELIKIERQTEL